MNTTKLETYKLNIIGIKVNKTKIYKMFDINQAYKGGKALNI